MEWRYIVDQNREFLRVECGKSIDRSLSTSDDRLDSLEIFLELAGQNIQLTQPSYAEITGSYSNAISNVFCVELQSALVILTTPYL